MLLCHPPPCSLAICVWARCREAAGLSAVHKLSATGALGEPACFPWLPASCLLGLHCLLAQGRSRLAQPQQQVAAGSKQRSTQQCAAACCSQQQCTAQQRSGSTGSHTIGFETEWPADTVAGIFVRKKSLMPRAIDPLTY
jgi:hypothetical protein